MEKFVHLHVHSEFSLLDGLGKIDQYVKIAKKYEMPGLALTDHGVLYGSYRFHNYAKKEGIKPIIGVELYVAPRSRFLKEGKEDKDPFHFLVLAKTKEGYKNLMKLVSKSFTEGFYYKPRVDKDLLLENSNGLIATSTCLGGEMATHALKNDFVGAKKYLSEMQAIFGKENFYLELQDHPEIDKQGQLNDFLIKLSEESGAPMVVTKDTHYAEKEDAVAQDALVCIQTNREIADPNRLNMTDADFSLNPPDEFFERFSHVLESIKNTVKISDEVENDFFETKWVFPEPGFSTSEKTDADILREIVWERGKKKLGRDFTEEEIERIEYEMDIIVSKGYDKYTLIVMDFMDYARNNGIPTNVRGSAAGSLVSYIVGISPVNPLVYGLPFERYLNAERPSPPDVDMDIADESRQDLLQYAIDKYGEDNVAQIITFGRMHAKAAIRDVGRVMGKPYNFVDKIAKMIPDLPPAAGRVTIERALKLSNEMKAAYETNSEIKDLIDLAKKVEGTARHSSTHAAGVIITPKPVDEYVPLSADQNGNPVTQFEFHELESQGLIKFDFLGLTNLSTVAHVFDTIRAKYGRELSLDAIPLDDKKTFELISKGDTFGVFQLESEGMRRMLRKLKPSHVKDVSAAVALYRPGPMNFIDEFVHNKNNKNKITYIDDRFKKILKDSYGLIVYQDDVLYIAVEIAGYNWTEVDKFRKAIGKKIPGEMQKQKEKFINGLLSAGVKKKQVDDLWHKVETFAGYGFNKAHAACYGSLAYQTAYLKTNYPSEYMAAILQSHVGSNDKIGETIKECKRMGIEVLPPDVNESYKRFTSVDDKTIRFGLLAIKNVGEGVVDGIIKERKQNGNFKSIRDFFERVDYSYLSKRGLESLMKCGFFDTVDPNRRKIFDGLETLQGFAKSIQEHKKSGQISLFGGGGATESFKVDLVEKEDYPNREKSLFEREYLGLYISFHPLDSRREKLEKDNVLTPDEINNSYVDKLIICAGVFSDVKRKITKKGSYMAFSSFEGFYKQLETVFFPKSYEMVDHVKPGEAMIVVGRVSAGQTLEALKSGIEEVELKIVVEKVYPFTKDTNIEKLKESLSDLEKNGNTRNNYKKNGNGSYKNGGYGGNSNHEESSYTPVDPSQYRVRPEEDELRGEGVVRLGTIKLLGTEGLNKFNLWCVAYYLQKKYKSNKLSVSLDNNLLTLDFSIGRFVQEDLLEIKSKISGVEGVKIIS